MIFRNLSFLLFMGVMAVHIWVRDTSWMTSPENTLPIIIALPLFVWLGSPWKLRSTPLPLPPGGLITGASGYILGLLLDITLLLAAGWVCLLWAWISSRMEQDTLPRIRRLMVLPVLAFPWLSTEGTRWDGTFGSPGHGRLRRSFLPWASTCSTRGQES